MRVFTAILAATLLIACSPKKDAADAAPAHAAEAGDVATAEPASPELAPASENVGIPTGETGGMCGGIAGIQCLNSGDYCEMAEGECVNIADVAGTCAPKPEACTMQYDPVCGCDGKTYGNACSAAAEGVSVASRGECPAAE